MLAAKNGHTDCLHARINSTSTPDTVDIANRDNQTPLTLAARNAHWECIDLLIESGADVNFPEYGFTVLLEAARKGHATCVDILLRSGASVIVKCVSFNDLICQAQIEQDGSADVLIHTGADMSVILTSGEAALFSAVSNCYVDCVISLLSAGVDVNNVTKCYSSALMVAAAAGAGSFTCMKLLLTVGAYVNKTNVNGKNGLQICIARNRDKTKEKSTCMLLYAAGEYIDTTAEHFTFLGERHPIPEYLKQAGQALSLKQTCRITIRRHLIYLNPHLHLFGRISELKLPSLMASYLVFGMALD